MGVFTSNQLVTVASIIVCPNGMTNITASSGELEYPESGTYGKNETKCWSITVPETYYGIRYRFSRIDVEVCSGCECDYLQRGNSYNYLHMHSKLCGRYSYNYLQGYVFNVYWTDGLTNVVSGSTVYLRFVSDNTVHYTGFKLSFIATSRTGGRVNYLNATEDETIEFGTPKVDIENYPSNYAEQWILIVPEGRKVQIDFDIFELEDSEDCKNDYVEFREASIMVGDPKRIYGHFGPILTNRLCGNVKPNSILSQGNMVWVQFVSDRNSITVYKGLKASFKAVGKFFVMPCNTKECLFCQNLEASETEINLRSGRMGVLKFNQLITAASVIVLLLFLERGQCDSICPNGITNITASSGEIEYPESGTYGGTANYLNVTEDETIEFGTPKVDIENYLSNYAEQWILIVPEGRNVQIDFDIFELEDSEDCKNDYVEFREASIMAGDPKRIYGHFGPILTGRLCGNTKPNSILSQGNMVWVQFISDRNSTTVYKGLKASFKAGQGSGLPVSRPMMLLFLSALIMHVSKNNLF